MTNQPGGAERRRFPLPRASRPEGLREFAQHSVGAVLMVCALFSLLGYMYLAGTADPAGHTRHVPVAVVDLDRGADLSTPIGTQHLDLGESVVGGLIDGNDWARLDMHVVSPEEAREGLLDARYFVVVTVPEDFSARVAALMDGAVGRGEAQDGAVVHVDSSPRQSLASVQVAQRLADAMQTSFDSRLGGQILDKTRQLAEARGTPDISVAAATALAHPVRATVGSWNPLPDGMSNGTLPMFYALVVILAGFTGAMVISNLLDARLGFVPLEFGPVALTAHLTEHGRLLVLVRKFVVTLITAPLVSAIYLAIAHAVGVGGFSYWNAFWISVLGIVAVGWCAHTVIVATGSVGLLINLVVFVILGIPTSGGATPPEMLPPLFRAVGRFEPMHQLYDGLRSVMFFDSRWGAGLAESVTVLAAWAVIGLVLGVVVAMVYDRMGMRRQHVERRVDPSEFTRRMVKRTG